MPARRRVRTRIATTPSSLLPRVSAKPLTAAEADELTRGDALVFAEASTAQQPMRDIADSYRTIDRLASADAQQADATDAVGARMCRRQATIARRARYDLYKTVGYIKRGKGR